jgi:hypothetical protein
MKKVDELIKESLEGDYYVRLIFKLERPPRFGKFVQLNDAEDLLKKGMIRFVSDLNISAFEAENRHVRFTRIHLISEFLTMKLFRKEKDLFYEIMQEIHRLDGEIREKTLIANGEKD